jgi:hypothetical protein
MPIYSQPFPKEGTGKCPTMSTAQRIVDYAVFTDGRAILQSDLDRFVEWETVLEREDVKLEIAKIKDGTKLDSIRKPISRLWQRMSKKAKAKMLGAQYQIAIDYLDSCVDVIREEFNNDIVPTHPLHLPTPNELLGKWLN